MTAGQDAEESFPRRYIGKGSELFNELRDLIGSVVGESEALSPDQKEALISRVVEQIRFNFGGQQLYVPKCTAHDITERDLEMYAAFDGRNQNELAKKYGVAVQTVYRRLRLISQHPNHQQGIAK